MRTDTVERLLLFVFGLAYGAVGAFGYQQAQAHWHMEGDEAQPWALHADLLNGKPYYDFPGTRSLNGGCIHNGYEYSPYGQAIPADQSQDLAIKEVAWRLEQVERKLKIQYPYVGVTHTGVVLPFKR